MGKIAIISLASIGVLLTSVARAADTSPAVLQKHTSKISAALPTGWSARAEDGMIIVQCDRQLKLVEAGFNTSGLTSPNLESLDVIAPATAPGLNVGNAIAAHSVPLKPKLNFALFLRPPVTGEELASRQKKNADREKVLELLQTHLTKIPREMNDYHPTNADDKMLVDAYHAAQAGLPVFEIPSYFADDTAFIWCPPQYRPVDDAAQDELARVYKAIAGLYSQSPLH